MKKNYLICFVLISVLFSGCAYRSAYKKAAKYEAAKMYSAAVDNYLYSLSKKPSFVDSQIGLMRTLTIYKGELEDEIDRAYLTLDDNKVVETYLKLDQLCEKSAGYQVEVEIEARTKGQYEEAKNRYLTNHYATAQQLMDEEKFADAQKQLEAIVKVDPTYRDSKKMLVVSRCEPIYRRGVTQMQSQKYRTAYNTFQNVLTIDANYKDARELKSEALEKGMLTVAFTPFVNEWRYKNFCDLVRIGTMQTIQKKNNPFVCVVDLNNTDAMLREQKKALQYGLNLKAGAVIPVRAHLNCEILNITLAVAQPKQVQKKGYIKETKKDKSVVYHKVYYTEWTRTQTCSGTIAYNLKSTETGLTLTSGTSRPTSSDRVNYASYDGKYSGILYSGSWESQKSASDSDRVGTSLSSMTSARRTLKTEAEMQKMLAETVVDDISRTLLYYNPE